jgi:hypothetical protein
MWHPQRQLVEVMEHVVGKYPERQVYGQKIRTKKDFALLEHSVKKNKKCGGYKQERCHSE